MIVPIASERIVVATSRFGVFVSIRPRHRWYRAWAVLVPFNFGMERG